MYHLVKSFEQMITKFDNEKGPSKKVWCYSSVVRIERVGEPGAWTKLKFSGGSKAQAYMTLYPSNIAVIRGHYTPFCRWSELLGLTAFTHDRQSYIVHRHEDTRRNEANRLRWPKFQEEMRYDVKAEKFLNPVFDTPYRRNMAAHTQWLKDWKEFKSYLITLAKLGTLEVPNPARALRFEDNSVAYTADDFVAGVRNLDITAPIQMSTDNRAYYVNLPKDMIADRVFDYYESNRKEIQAAAGALIEVK